MVLICFVFPSWIINEFWRIFNTAKQFASLFEKWCVHNIWKVMARLTMGHLGHVPQAPTLRGPHKNDHVLKTMNQNSVELRAVLLLPKANISLWDSPAVTAVWPVRLCWTAGVMKHQSLYPADNHDNILDVMFSSFTAECMYCLLTDVMVMSISHMR